MGDLNYSYENFVQNLIEINKISDQIHDNWKLINNSNDYCGSYLVKQFKSSIELQSAQEPDEIQLADKNNEKSSAEQNDWEIRSALDEFQDELSIVDDSVAIAPVSTKTTTIQFEYHVLYHQSYQIPYLCFNAYRMNGTKLTIHEAWQLFRRNTSHHQSTNIPFTDESMLSILTEMDHPILFQPFLTLHPCRTAELLHSRPESTNLVLTFLSTIGPAVNLPMDLRYGLSKN